MKRLRIVAAVIAGIVVLYLVASSDNPPLALTIVLAIAGFGWLTYRASKIKLPEAPKKQLPPLSDNHGSAAFAPSLSSLTGASANSAGVFFGKSSSPEARDFPLALNPGAPVCSTPENHTLIFARTRTGKGTRVIVPTLLRYSTGSLIVIDPKGENAAITARARAALGSKVHILNPWGVFEGIFTQLGFQPATFNPLDILDRNDPALVSKASALAASISPSEGEKDKFWKDAAAQIIAAILIWITDQEFISHPPFPAERKTLGRLAEVVAMTHDDFQKYLSVIATSPAFGGAIAKKCGNYIGLTEITFGPIMTNLSQALSFLGDPLIVAATERSSFSIEDLFRRKTTLYLILPPDQMKIQRLWLRLVIMAARQTLLTKRPATAPRCMFLLDEFAGLGRMDEMPNDLAQMSGYGLDYVLILQGLDQLRDIYGNAHGAIVNNCAYKWFCNLNDLDSAKYLSEMLGKKTVRTVTKGESTGASSGVGGASSTNQGESITYGEMGKHLLSPDEIIKLGRDVAVLLAPGTSPHYLRPVDYWELPSAFNMFRDLDPAMLRKPPLQYDPNPLRAGSTGYIYTEPTPQPSAPTPENHSPRSLWRQFADWIKGAEQPPAQTIPAPPPSPAPQPRPIDYRRYANWKPPGPTPEPSAPSPSPESPPAAPATPPQPRPINFRRYQHWGELTPPPAPASDESAASEPETPATPPKKKPKPPFGNWDVDSDEFTPFPKKPKSGGDT